MCFPLCFSYLSSLLLILSRLFLSLAFSLFLSLSLFYFLSLALYLSPSFPLSFPLPLSLSVFPVSPASPRVHRGPLTLSLQVSSSVHPREFLAWPQRGGGVSPPLNQGRRRRSPPYHPRAQRFPCLCLVGCGAAQGAFPGAQHPGRQHGGPGSTGPSVRLPAGGESGPGGVAETSVCRSPLPPGSDGARRPCGTSSRLIISLIRCNLALQARGSNR